MTQIIQWPKSPPPDSVPLGMLALEGKNYGMAAWTGHCHLKQTRARLAPVSCFFSHAVGMARHMSQKNNQPTLYEEHHIWIQTETM